MEPLYLDAIVLQALVVQFVLAVDRLVAQPLEVVGVERRLQVGVHAELQLPEHIDELALIIGKHSAGSQSVRGRERVLTGIGRFLNPAAPLW